MTVDLAGDAPGVVDDVFLAHGPRAPDDERFVFEVDAVVLDLTLGHGEGERPLVVAAHRLHELRGDQQRQIELAQPAILALAADEVDDIRMADIEGCHLRASSSAGGGHREAHLVVDIHERQRPGGVGAGARDICALGPKRRELVTDAAPCFEGQAGLVDLFENIRHGIADHP